MANSPDAFANLVCFVIFAVFKLSLFDAAVKLWTQQIGLGLLSACWFVLQVADLSFHYVHLSLDLLCSIRDSNEEYLALKLLDVGYDPR